MNLRLREGKEVSSAPGTMGVFSQVVTGNWGFLSSYDGDLREPLVLPQESPLSMRARGVSGDSSAVGAGA